MDNNCVERLPAAGLCLKLTAFEVKIFPLEICCDCRAGACTSPSTGTIDHHTHRVTGAGTGNAHKLVD
eukprot:1145520-Pelagomonas_calceolata.AAC.3